MGYRGAGATAAVLLALAGILPARGDAAGSFQWVGGLEGGGIGAQATLLTDGTVLVSCGLGVSGPLAEDFGIMDLFDPRTNGLVLLSQRKMVPGSGHRAVRLQDGRVLLVGGGEAELFDPSTRRHAPTGGMRLSRSDFTATRLADGRVLLAGGRDTSGAATATAELFDPVSGQFQVTGSMTTARSGHLAVLLADGRVVVLGGQGSSHQALATVEIYDPKTGTFSPKGGLAEARMEAEASPVPDGRILVLGGLSEAGVRKSVEMYDPATGESTITGALSEPRASFALAPLPDGRLLAAGGTGIGTGEGSVLRTAELFDPTSGKASPTAPMTAERSGPAAVALPDGRVLILGGSGYSPYAPTPSQDSAELYVPASAPKPTSP